MPRDSLSWVRLDIPGLIARKRVDWSIFEYGSHIPQDFHSYFNKANNDHLVERGKNHRLFLEIDSKEFEANLFNINIKDFAKDTLQIRYDSNKNIKQYLTQELETSYKYLIDKKSKLPEGKKPNIIVPDEYAEYIDFYKTSEPFRYRLEIHKSTNQYNSSTDNQPQKSQSETDTDFLEEFANGNNEELSSTREIQINPTYTLEQFISDTGIDQEIFKKWIRVIDRKGQAILYGPPGTGKTYVAEHIAKYLVQGDDGVVELVQFHPAYSYEDFMQGIRPRSINGVLEYPIVSGRFLEFCNRAKTYSGKSVLIIDEINRANLSRVFGELMYLLEYRDKSIPLSSGGLFSIPKNVIILGTMNTADRSIALVDFALRRRFAFLELRPNFVVLKKFMNATNFPIDNLIDILINLNRYIDDKHYEIGISFFLKKDLSDQIQDVWEMEIEPYLEEYFYDQPNRVEEFRWDKIKGKLYS